MGELTFAGAYGYLVQTSLVPWSYPKHITILWMAALDRLPTWSRLIRICGEMFVFVRINHVSTWDRELIWASQFLKAAAISVSPVGFNAVPGFLTDNSGFELERCDPSYHRYFLLHRRSTEFLRDGRDTASRAATENPE
ncbi:hypothetical protein F3Y22_tig00110332pilonHSYRG00193 [Hibiscus syriacus]|uniref:Uncharacterized protein n=1 Tax=Hibiscus syriacus TaxID=106335 RepID=A0A6A3AZ68_HIBSY|nr:hypothetical protein F3Y22_tig00110332pilonHSYRG00193 [Hibiscus syriacus]